MAQHGTADDGTEVSEEIAQRGRDLVDLVAQERADSEWCAVEQDRIKLRVQRQARKGLVEGGQRVVVAQLEGEPCPRPGGRVHVGGDVDGAVPPQPTDLLRPQQPELPHPGGHCSQAVVARNANHVRVAV